MRAAFVDNDRRLCVGEFADPIARKGTILASIKAAALTNLDVAVATGRHYFSPKQLPAIIGREAVVETADGRRWFAGVGAIASPYGSMAERTVVDPALLLPVPASIDDAFAAALGNAGLAAWLALCWRGRFRTGDRVLILGATGASGLIAVAAAAILGARSIVAAGRNAEALERARSLGATAVVDLNCSENLAAAFEDAGGPADLVLDYVNGSAAEAALGAMAIGGRMVQIGSPAGSATCVDAQTIRKMSLDVLGFAYYHAPIEAQIEAYRYLCVAAGSGGLAIDYTTLALEDFEEAWTRQQTGTRQRLVIVP